MPGLFDPLTLRSVTFRNRIGMSPMCQYSARRGMPTTWHAQHLGSRAAGGCGLVMTEATAVHPDGRISLEDAGIWTDTHASAWGQIAGLIREQGAVAGMQLAHAGRKAGTAAPWEGGKPYSDEQLREAGEKDWHPVGADALAFDAGWRIPKPLWKAELEKMVFAWVDAARFALAAGFEVIELHMAHGYLLHSFLSAVSNRRPDAYGGSLENRMRFPLQIVRGVRAVWPESLPLFVRISCTDWLPEGHDPPGWDIDEACEFAARLKDCGVDLIDCSSGGNVPMGAVGPVAAAELTEPLYQVRFAERIRKEVGIATAAVGLITTPRQAQGIVESGQADIVLLGRQLLREPYWPQAAAAELGSQAYWPRQYGRAKQ